MTTILIYNPDNNTMERYEREENQYMPYSTYLTVNEFRGSSNSTILWSDRRAIAFENILKNPGMRDIIDSITVEGHADKTGDEFSNMTLSLNRANAVIRYMFESNPNLLLNYNNYFAAAGYSEFRPIDPGDSAQALAKNRRIEFAIKIKDSTIQKVINDYLEETEGITDTD
jgi:chemotaxis protein MotB